MNATSAKTVRCPYCVLGEDFRPMIRHVDGRHICNKCGHLARPDDYNFKCPCPKCVDLNWQWGCAVASIQGNRGFSS